MISFQHSRHNPQVCVWCISETFNDYSGSLTAWEAEETCSYIPKPEGHPGHALVLGGSGVKMVIGLKIDKFTIIFTSLPTHLPYHANLYIWAPILSWSQLLLHTPGLWSPSHLIRPCVLFTLCPFGRHLSPPSGPGAQSSICQPFVKDLSIHGCQTIAWSIWACTTHVTHPLHPLPCGLNPYWVQYQYLCCSTCGCCCYNLLCSYW